MNRIVMMHKKTTLKTVIQMGRLLNSNSNKKPHLTNPRKKRTNPRKKIMNPTSSWKSYVVALKIKRWLKKILNNNWLWKISETTIKNTFILFLDVLMLRLILLTVLTLRIWPNLACYVGVFIGSQVENNFWKSFIIIDLLK